MPEQPATPSTPPALDIGAATDVGRVREANEDAFLAVRRTGIRAGDALVAVADGMGGHKAGEVASGLAVEALQRMLDDGDPSLEADTLLVRALESGNGAIWAAAAADFEKEGMGTTIVAALLSADGGVVIANVGDSRGYTFRGGQAKLVTVDHT
ncbi:MAG: protein phosphatase 2C domain-containing protein, partial [Chloroflexi bacterium]|nr:protein phosphatase 2C domain-containing protein [Chloroflexota bacterium]